MCFKVSLGLSSERLRRVTCQPKGHCRGALSMVVARSRWWARRAIAIAIWGARTVAHVRDTRLVAHLTVVAVYGRVYE